ncbi:hypothetical protein EV2_018756 [Malus domestica]
MAQEQERVKTPNNQAENVLTNDVTVLDNLEDNDHDPMGALVFENMEISMVHVLPAEFQPLHTSQISWMKMYWRMKQHKLISS